MTMNEARGSSRLTSIDILRGLVMVLMAIDHVRVYAGVPAGGPPASIFFTRWITHFCAPVFVFLAGTGAFLHGRALGDISKLSRFLASRGLLLVVLELTLIRFLWSFNLHFGDFILAGVIWMLGWCMVVLAVMVRLSTRTITIIGLAMIVLQPLFGYVPLLLPEHMRESFGLVWEFIYPSGAEGPPQISILYVLVPWIGVMAAGYGFGAKMLADEATRRRFCLRVGLGATGLFAMIGTALALTQDQSSEAAPLLFRILSQEKYPPSVPFLLMTLGPAIAVIPVFERARGWTAGVLTTFGRVPMFYYLLHIPVIHIAALAVTYLREGAMHPEWYATAPYADVPDASIWSLGLLYLVFFVCVAVLYVACRWFAGVKSRRRGGWLSYV